jgi:Domain of unknown function (DUF222)/HNH endonuclease
MKTTKAAQIEVLDDEIATLAAHMNAATARWLELVGTFREAGGAAGDDFASWLAFRCGISRREAHEYVRVTEALEELPAIGGAFRRGELSFTKVRGLTRVATPASEEALLELGHALTAPQLERALRAYRRVTAAETRDTHELEYVDYYWDDDGSLVLRARLAAEDATILVRALDAARERVWERRRGCAREEPSDEPALDMEPPRPVNVEAFVELADAASASLRPCEDDHPRVIVHVDAATLATDGHGRSELEPGPVIAPETARRLACDAETVTTIEQNGLPLSVGRRRRTVPRALRHVLDARDERCCRWPRCTRRSHLQAHHRHHWAQGGETSLSNLVLLCWHHHRLVHEGGYTIENGDDGELRFRNRHGVLCPSFPRSPPRGSTDALVEQNLNARLSIDAWTNRNGDGDPLDLALTVAAIEQAVGGAQIVAAV